MSRRSVSIGFIAAGVLVGLGGNLHPRGSGDVVDDYLISMFTSDLWNPSHLVQMFGLFLAAGTYVIAQRKGVFGESVSRWLTIAALGAAFAACELIPHLAAASEAEELRRHAATPILDVHMVMQLVATPALGLTTAALAIAVARDARTTAAWILAAIALACGFAYALAGPLVVLTEDVAYTMLFPFQAGLAVWLLGTGVRLVRRTAVPIAA